jgi:Leucine-rich repeat (LRR) protein
MNNLTINDIKNFQLPNNQEKIIDSSFFLKNIIPQGTDYVFAPCPLLAEHKWVILRNSLQTGDFIRIELPFLHQNHPSRQAGHLSNFLKILRLTPQDVSPTIHIDISSFVHDKSNILKRTFPQIIWLKGYSTKAILPCVQLPPIWKEAEQNSITSAWDVIKNCSNEIKGRILSNLHLYEFEKGKNYITYYEKAIGNHLRVQFSKRAQEIWKKACKRNSGALPFFSVVETKKIGTMRPYVTEWDTHNLPLTAQFITLLGEVFPNIEELNLRGCSSIDRTIRGLQNFKNLKILQLTNSTVTGKTFSSLAPSVKKLNLQDCSDLKEEAAVGLAQSHIVELNISETPLRGKYFAKLPKSLKRFSCFFCIELQDEALSGLEGSLLEELDISYTPVQGTYFSVLPRSLKKLNCKYTNLDDDAILALRESVLEELNISYTYLQGTYFDQLPRTLKILDCSQCTQVGLDIILKLKNCTFLEELCVPCFFNQDPNFYPLPNSLKKFIAGDICWLKKNNLFVKIP